jgi:hypothetical protein
VTREEEPLPFADTLQEAIAQVEAKYAAQLGELEGRVAAADDRLRTDQFAFTQEMEAMRHDRDAQDVLISTLKEEVLRHNDRAMQDQDEIEDLGEHLERLKEQLETQQQICREARDLQNAQAPRIPALTFSAITSLPAAVLRSSDLEWELDVLARDDELQSAGGALYQVGCAVAQSLGLFDHSAVDGNTLRRVFLQIQRGYVANPYHNLQHAADMTNAAFVMLRETGVLAKMTPVEKLATLVACLGHDHQHPGRTNAFMIAINDPVAVRYNDQAVLENHHLASTYSLFEKAELNLLAALPADDVKRLRSLMVKIILGTDMSKHMQHLSEYESRLAKRPFDLAHVADRAEVIALIVHAADISGLARPFEIASKWTMRVQAEFRSQGDEEAALGLPISFGCEPNVDVPRSQVGFADLFVLPLFRTLQSHFPGAMTPIVNHLIATRNQCGLQSPGGVKAISAQPLLPPRNATDSIEVVSALQDQLKSALGENVRLSSELSRLLTFCEAHEGEWF